MKVASNGIEGYGGCNFYQNDGDILMESGKISINSIVAGAKDCGSEINTQETQFYQALRTASSYKLEDRLELFDANGEIVLIFEKSDRNK